MVNPKKIQTVKELEERLKRTKSLVLIDYSGLSVPQQQKLRRKIEEAGGEFRVTKNTLLKLALENLKLKTQNLKLFGPTATLFSYEDEIAPIKALVKFAEEFESPKIKIGFFEGKTMKKEAILELAKIPSRNDLLTRLVYTVNWPISGLVNVLEGNTRKLINLIDLISN